MWIKNLANWFTDLPDGMILFSTLLLQTGYEEDGEFLDALMGVGRENTSSTHVMALETTMEAIRRGPPLYRQGLGLLDSNLTILLNIFSDDAQTHRKLKRAHDAIRHLRLRVDPTQAFCVFNFRGLGL
jgi:hypothetical protein